MNRMPVIKKLLDHQVNSMMIVKQAVLKSLIEASVIVDRDTKSEALVMDWVDFIYRNGSREWEAVNDEAEPFN